ncbi:uncharacterized protein [Solanum tuberosum]|uniref:Uncharacterized protein n=1 Tax=Solanum tuberosum TaxID=4113 RepID=M0ZVC5_SOLTU|nr:PREDICTED: uncharacterized protein LOC102597124 [Solanum tuberosum]XP_015161927.1 PREDICTED: uncharacterized protein LOC102597124 [Solanum tuberosum]KAH0765337.1 hypothetical protein KY285_001208 [Solanum tuberosum]
MDHTPCDFVIDLEMCNNTIEEVATTNPISIDKIGKRFFNNFCDDEQLIRPENGFCMISNVKDDHELTPENVKVKGLVAENGVEKKNVNDKRKSGSAKKPPRPPRGLSLDAADQKLIKEIAELAMMKRVRIERIKALKKMKAAKASSNSSSSSTSSVLAFLFTVLFFLVLCFQGMSSGSSEVISHDSPQPSGSRSNSFIIQQYYSDLSARTASKSAGSPNLVEQVS